MNNQHKLVSINLTTYNREELLPRCLDSILSQSYPTFEVIIVDDFSSDLTHKIIQEYQRKDNRIKFYRHPQNLGNAHARNTAFENSSGYYIAFMDDDDEWIDKDKLKKQIEVFERSSNNLAIVCTGVTLIDEKGKRKNKIVEKPENLKRHILGGNGIIYSPTVMTKRNILEQVGGFDIKMPRGIDSDFYRKCIVRYGYDVYFMAEITTAINEYGDDRITPQSTNKALKQSFINHSITLIKYSKSYLIYPFSLIKRIKALIKILAKMIKYNLI